MNDTRGMIRKINVLCQPINCLDGPFPQCSCSLDSFVRLDDDRDDEIQVFFKNGTESLKSIKYLDLCLHSPGTKLMIERPQNQRDNGGKKRLEVRGKGISEGFNKRYEGQLKRCVVPELLHKTEYRHRIISDVLLDDPNEDRQLLQVKFLQTSG